MSRLGATVVGSGTRFEVWAPDAQRVEVELDDGTRHELAWTEHADDPGTPTWVGVVESVRAGDRYGISLDGGATLPDPASRHQPDGVHGRSAVVDPGSFEWTDDEWSGVALADALIYELHVGTFTPEGTFDAARGQLDRLVELGVTVIEVMPVNGFPGERNWGYDGVFPFATQHSYGGPEAFARFVDAAHGAGLAVILDVVYNHIGPEGNVLGRFAPYFTDDYRTPWGPAVNVAGRGSDGVRRYLTENVESWIGDFHLDGLRADAVHAIVDPTARPVVAELVEAAHRVGRDAGRTVLVTLESAANDPRMIRAGDEGGWGADAMWNDDVHHALRVALTGEQHEYYAAYDGAPDLARALTRNQVYDGRYSPTIGRRHGVPADDVASERFIVFTTNHDHVGNTPDGRRLLADADPADPRHRLAASFVLLGPFTPLLFMGEEYGEPAPFPYFIDHGDPDLVETVRRGRQEEFSGLDWAGGVADPASIDTFRSAVLDPSIVTTDPVRAGRLAMYTELLALRRRLRPLLAGPVDEREVRHDGGLVVSIRRRKGETAELWCNFSGIEVAVPAGSGGGSSIVFSSADERWIGADDPAGPDPSRLAPWECRLQLSRFQEP